MAHYDVVIIGGGPAGSTTGSLLKKYDPGKSVLIVEREKFPRDHVGESQLPPISKILVEMGCWDEIEAAEFPIKIGVTYRWGKTPELWDFEFVPKGSFKNEPRPAKYEGQRVHTAFQVDRAAYDDILLKHASKLGCEVREETRVTKVRRDGNSVSGVELDNGEVVTATHYVDATGHPGVLRRAMGVKTSSPTTLQNIAVWDYWQNADWAIEIGVGGTRVQVMSQGYGWIWFIPLSPTRTSIGLIVPAQYYKNSGKSPEELYVEAINGDVRISALIKNATSENKLASTKDWSFLAENHYGDNWWLVGESAGFADPILAAGMTITHQAGRELAYSILEMDYGKTDPAWIKDQYQRRQTQRLRNHIRFADFWYTSNTQFTDLQEFTKELAADNGLDLSPERAWQWLSQGGFIDDNATFGAAGYSLEQIIQMGEFVTDIETANLSAKNNIFELNLRGASSDFRAIYHEGRIHRDECFTRDGKLLPLVGPIELWVQILQRAKKLPDIHRLLMEVAEKRKDDFEFMENVMLRIGMALEAMITDGWVKASYDPSLPLTHDPIRPTGIYRNTDPPVGADA